MKKTILILFYILISASNTLAQDPSFMGKYCWDLIITDDTTGLTLPATFILTTDIVKMGRASYSLIGYVTDSGDNPAIFSGVGQIIDSTLYLSLIGSQRHLNGGWRDSSVLHAEINTSTLSGTFYDVGNDFNATTRARDSSRYSAGTIEIATSCP